MLREILDPLALFATPFLIYALLMPAIAARFPKESRWSRGHVSVLALIGLTMALVGVLAFGFSAKRHFGQYVPAHIENGQLMPGHMD
ncbi:MAG: hypothetical protein KGQ46_03915 [Hyphomicrobiales bacterium]|nr:hypothetical protein [Hyphomicrobiales bacterium]MDE2114958.1 hypothetical protein [Hyphomicrobiales bacterium]